MTTLQRLAALGLLCGMAWGCASTSAAPSQQPAHKPRPHSRRPSHSDKDPSQKKYGFNKVLQFATTKVEFGELKREGPSARRAVAFKNTGKETVTVQGVTTSCPCTMSMVSALTIPPGGEGTLDIFVDPKTAAEKFDVLISVEYKGSNRIDRVEIAGTVKS